MFSLRILCAHSTLNVQHSFKDRLDDAEGTRTRSRGGTKRREQGDLVKTPETAVEVVGTVIYISSEIPTKAKHARRLGLW